MPAVFAGHGAGPAFFMSGAEAQRFGPNSGLGDASAGAAFFRGLAGTLPSAAPPAIAVVSAHYETPPGTVAVTAGARPELIYDYGGFPDHTYDIKYPAPGDPGLAARVVDLLKQGGCVKG
jgi:aromatic ring-opening dioxygenase catalytic subunit (LigB family)